ncbi:MAG: hypothetical protein IPG53_22710 [Ignavibacteriales bacterium]|nr:hypothetical protein [Ignavibacteriales bacterium]
MLIGNFGVAIRTNGTSDYRDVFNNHISGGGYYGFYGNAPLRFNNFWNNGRHYKTDNGSVVDSISNLIRFPMFVDEEKDYHLQAYSPLIDAGDTLVKIKTAQGVILDCMEVLMGQLIHILILHHWNQGE